MGRDLAFRMFARAGAVLGLAAITAMSYTGLAGAAPADRGNDPVVLKGSQVSGIEGTDPGKVVGFKWNGKWVQIPVQIDQRHTISSRSLYPDDTSSKYVTSIPFDIEVYADPKTRSGADADKTFDADDELVFMAADSGTTAPSAAIAPSGVIASSATKVTVDDPVGGGNSFVYLFKSDGRLNPSAGKDYVDYDFKLTKLTANQNMKDNYGYSNATNPEDSTVTTASYQLHSTGRWMEDEMKISAGGASDTDILDREAASAGGLSGCGRSEYTFSGNWDLDTSIGNERPDDDDEGTYVAVIDGPVRAVRDFMGANSGPYVESIHKYYADQEDKTIDLRVHPIPALYAWTDYSEAAIGMTYRDQLNESGDPIDGVPPATYNAPAANSILDGVYSWQQVTGSQGSVTTLVSAQASNTDRFDHRPGHEGENIYDYTNYYLDDSTPTGSNQRQCGGDLKSYGASGVGISGVFPNSDPVLGGAFPDTRDLSLSRIRYFGGPGATAAEASALRDRAQQPLTGSASKAGVKARTIKLSIKLVGKKPKARAGKKLTLKVKITNKGNVATDPGTACATESRISMRMCKGFSAIGSGKSTIVTLKPKVKSGKSTGKFKVKISARAGNTSGEISETVSF